MKDDTYQWLGFAEDWKCLKMAFLWNNKLGFGLAVAFAQEHEVRRVRHGDCKVCLRPQGPRKDFIQLYFSAKCAVL